MNTIFFQVQSEIIMGLFGIDWIKKSLSKKINHPALKRLCLSQQIVRNNGLIIDLNAAPSNLLDIAYIILSNFNIVSCSRDKDKGLKLGAFLNYGNSKVRKKIKSVIYEPNSFESLMTEFSFAAWNIDKMLDIEPYEETGWPDFKIKLPNVKLPVFVDCKMISKETNNNRYEKVIQKANSQIKKPGESCIGLAVIDITSKINPLKPGEKEEIDKIDEIKKIISKCLINNNTSVSAVLLFWDQCHIFNNGNNESIYIALTRNSLILKHKNPINPIPKSYELDTFGYTVEFFVKNEQLS